MKSTAFFVSIIVLGFLVQYFFPWWTIAIVCFASAFYFQRSPGISYAIAFSAVGVLWLGYAAFLNAANGGVLMSKMQALLLEFLKADSGFMKGLVSYLMWGGLGALVGGFAASSGAYARRLISGKIA